MAELQTKQEAVPAPAPVPTPIPAAVEPPLAEAPPVNVVEKKAPAPPPAADDTKALVVVDNESESVNSFFNFLAFRNHRLSSKFNFYNCMNIVS